MGLYKALKYFAFLVGGISIVFFIIVILKGDSAITESQSLQDSLLNPFLYLTYFVFFVAIVAVVIFVIAQLFKGGNLKAMMISMGIFLAIFLISFVLADGNPITYPNGTNISGAGAKWVSTGLNMFYILTVVAVLALFGSSLKRLTFKK